MSVGSTDVGALLTACLTADGAPLSSDRARLSERGWHRLPTAAAYHSVSAAAYVGMRESVLVPPDVLGELRGSYEALLHHHLLTLDTLRSVTAVLRRGGVEHVFLKGPVLAETVYPRPDLRDYGDLDVLVRPSQFELALQVLEAEGGRLIERNWELVLHLRKGELNLVMPRGVVVDLHWSLFYNDELRRSFRWPGGDVIARSRAVSIGGEDVAGPDPVDQLLHLCAHSCLGGCHRLGWLQDIRLAATRVPIEWSVFWDRAEDGGLALLAAVALDHVNRCFEMNLPIPDDAWSSGATWRIGSRGLLALRPPWRWHGGGASGHVLIAATRTSTRTSLRALGTGLRGALSELVHDPAHPWRRAWPRRKRAAFPNEMLRSAGGEAERAAYLRAVTSAEST